MSVSILILTLNEEINIARCLQSVSWSNDIVVVDSFSTDRTVQICEEYGVRVIQRKLINWAEHQNWINENISFKNEWIYYSDADEVVTPDLASELISISKNSSNEMVAYRVRYKNYFMGRWLKYSGGYPIWVLRFFKPGKVRWERLVNPRPVISGGEGKLKNDFLHYSFNKGLDAWFDKHNKYSHDEALEGYRVISQSSLNFSGLFSSDATMRRSVLKDLSFRMPARGLLRFIYQYFFKYGFMDGLPGLHWCLMMALYEYMIELKILEIKRKNNGLNI